MKYYRPKFFSVEELVYPEIYDIFSTRSIMFFDSRMLYTIDKIRQRYGATYINTWSFMKGRHVRKYAGLRSPNSQVGAEYSLHKFGKAFDMIFENVTAEEIREDMRKKPARTAYQNITRCEDDVSWLHVDNAMENYKGIYFFGGE